MRLPIPSLAADYSELPIRSFCISLTVYLSDSGLPASDVVRPIRRNISNISLQFGDPLRQSPDSIWGAFRRCPDLR
jgi:hypothetical protein